MPSSAAVLGRIAARLNQKDRVTASLSCRRLSEGFRRPEAWGHATVYKLSVASLEFLSRVRPKTISAVVTNSCVLEKWLEAAVMCGMHTNVKELGLVFVITAVPRKHAIMAHLADFQGLERLEIHCRRLERELGFVIPSLPNLRDLRVSDGARPALVDVFFFGAPLPMLRNVELDVCTSDILACAAKYSNLLRVVYHGERDTFEDADLGGVSLNALSVRSPGDATHLVAQVSRAKIIHSLAIECCTDVTMTQGMNVKDLTLMVRKPGVTLTVAYHVMRFMNTLQAVSMSPQAYTGNWTLKITGAGSWTTFANWLRRANMVVGLGGAVMIDPGDSRP